MLGVDNNFDKTACVKKANIETMLNTPGARTGIYISTISDNNDLSKQLEKNVSLNLGYKGNALTKSILSGEISASISDISEVKIRSDHSYALINAQRVFMPLNMQTYEINPEVLAFYSKYPEKFYEGCGVTGTPDPREAQKN